MSESVALPQLIRIVDGQARLEANNPWQPLPQDGSVDVSHLPAYSLLPLAFARENARGLSQLSQPIGVVIDPNDTLEGIEDLLPQLGLIGVQFPNFTDGRGYSTAYLLRKRLGWQGELRALGDILQDQLFALRRVGFDSFELRAGRDPHAAMRAFATFSGAYQHSVYSAGSVGVAP